MGHQTVWTNKDRSEHVVHAEAGDGNVLFDRQTCQPWIAGQRVKWEVGKEIQKSVVFDYPIE